MSAFFFISTVVFVAMPQVHALCSVAAPGAAQPCFSGLVPCGGGWEPVCRRGRRGSAWTQPPRQVRRRGAWIPGLTLTEIKTVLWLSLQIKGNLEV